MPRSRLVDLEQIATACRPFANLYVRHFIDGAAPKTGELEKACAALRTLSAVGGRLGRAIAALSSEVSPVSRDQLIEACGLVTRAALYGTERTDSGEQQPSARPLARRRTKPRAPDACQLRLPGTRA